MKGKGSRRESREREGSRREEGEERREEGKQGGGRRSEGGGRREEEPYTGRHYDFSSFFKYFL